MDCQVSEFLIGLRQRSSGSSQSCIQTHNVLDMHACHVLQRSKLRRRSGWRRRQERSWASHERTRPQNHGRWGGFHPLAWPPSPRRGRTRADVAIASAPCAVDTAGGNYGRCIRGWFAMCRCFHLGDACRRCRLACPLCPICRPCVWLGCWGCCLTSSPVTEHRRLGGFLLRRTRFGDCAPVGRSRLRFLRQHLGLGSTHFQHRCEDSVLVLAPRYRSRPARPRSALGLSRCRHLVNGRRRYNGGIGGAARVSREHLAIQVQSP
jgi:hypothetical protein